MWPVVLLACSQAHTLACNATPGAVYNPISRDFFAPPIAVPHDDNNEDDVSVVRHRRTTDTRRYAVNGLVLDDSPYRLTSLQRRTIYDAHRFLMVAYNLDSASETPHSFSVQTSNVVPSTSMVGLWSSGQITLFVRAIPSIDMLFVVTLHEFLHDLAFSNVNVGAGSFQDRTNDTTFQHHGSAVDSCFRLRGQSHTIYTDVYESHWKLDTNPFSTDVMEPVVPFGSVQISPCTLAVVIDTRPTWSLMTCRNSADCRFNYTCYSLGRYLGKMCLDLPPVSGASVANQDRLPSFTLYFYVVIILFCVLYQCSSMPSNKHSRLRALLIKPLEH